MFSEKSKEIADACRFCWMCRHLCPVGYVTGKEANTPRGKALLISMDNRGLPLTPDSADAMFQCCLCSACTGDCVTGYDPPVFIREARTAAVAEDRIPGHIREIIDRAIAGSLSGEQVREGIITDAAALPQKAEVFLYLGDSALRGGAPSAPAMMRLLKNAGVSFTVLKEEPDCGAHLGDLVGFVDEVKQKAVTCLEKIADAGAQTVVVLDPSCARFFRRQCAAWGILPLETEFVTATSYCAGMIDP